MTKRLATVALWIVVGACGGAGSPDARGLSAVEIDTLRQALLERGERDQYYRKLDYGAMDDSTRRWAFAEGAAVDSGNTAWLKAVVAAVGWPDSARFGAEAARSAFLIVQHSDRDPAFQDEMLPLLATAVDRMELDPKELAYLTDRVRVKQGRPQVYGTQYAVDTLPDGSVIADADGAFHYLLPIVEDVDRLDERRAAVGLEPWREYEKRMAESQGRSPADRLRASGE